MKRIFLRNFSKFIGKYLSSSVSVNKVAGVRPATLFKKRLSASFSGKSCEVFNSTYFIEQFRETASVRQLQSFTKYLGLTLVFT